MFHQNLVLRKSKSPVISGLQDFACWGCPDGIEPTTFRTTSKLSNCLEPLYLSAFQRAAIVSLLTNCSYHTLSFVGNAIVWPAFLRIVALQSLFRLGVGCFDKE